MAIFTWGIIALTVLISLHGFHNNSSYEKSIFSVQGILFKREYYRLITSQFFHIDWAHLIFNMFSLYSFARHLELIYGIPVTALIYFGSAIGGDILALILHRKNLHYRAVGASGAICGIIFASIFLLPGGSVIIFPIPIPIPSWLFAILFILATIYGIGRGTSDIGHEAHLGGALSGLIIAILIRPDILYVHYILLLSVITPVIIFLIIMRGRSGI
jgi:membrane associated rhomboid family serine protease